MMSIGGDNRVGNCDWPRYLKYVIEFCARRLRSYSDLEAQTQIELPLEADLI